MEETFEEIGTIDAVIAEIKSQASDMAIRDKVETALGEYRLSRKYAGPGF